MYSLPAILDTAPSSFHAKFSIFLGEIKEIPGNPFSYPVQLAISSRCTSLQTVGNRILVGLFLKFLAQCFSEILYKVFFASLYKFVYYDIFIHFHTLY